MARWNSKPSASTCVCSASIGSHLCAKLKAGSRLGKYSRHSPTRRICCGLERDSEGAPAGIPLVRLGFSSSIEIQLLPIVWLLQSDLTEIGESFAAELTVASASTSSPSTSLQP